MALIEPNGSGKTTLINLLGGQLSLTGGRIFLFGQDNYRKIIAQGAPEQICADPKVKEVYLGPENARVD